MERLSRVKILSAAAGILLLATPFINAESIKAQESNRDSLIRPVDDSYTRRILLVCMAENQDLDLYFMDLTNAFVNGDFYQHDSEYAVVVGSPETNESLTQVTGSRNIDTLMRGNVGSLTEYARAQGMLFTPSDGRRFNPGVKVKEFTGTQTEQSLAEACYE